RRPLFDEPVAGGRWVAHNPNSDRRGYHISRLIVPGEDVGALVKTHRATGEDDVRAHYNFDLGIPYAPKGGSLTEDTVKACRRKYACPDRYDGEDWVTMGADVGRVLHVRISRWLRNGKAAPLF